jgi:hypothetical protein
MHALSVELNIREAKVWRWEKGRGIPKPPEIAKLAKLGFAIIRCER